MGVSYPDSVSYQVSIFVTPEYIDRYGSRQISAKLLYIGFGEVGIDISVPNSCDCEADKVYSAVLYAYDNAVPRNIIAVSVTELVLMNVLLVCVQMNSE